MTAVCLPEVIETARLTIRPFRLEDVDDVLSYAADSEWGKYLINVPRPYARSHAAEFVTRQTLLDRAEYASWAIAHAGAVIGGVSIRFRLGQVVAEMGWSIHRRLWGRGFATEAALAVVEAAFEAQPRLARIGATADTRNVASQRVMEKIGMKKEGVLRQARVVDGECFDEAHFSVLRSEWRPR